MVENTSSVKIVYSCVRFSIVDNSLNVKNKFLILFNVVIIEGISIKALLLIYHKFFFAKTFSILIRIYQIKLKVLKF